MVKDSNDNVFLRRKSDGKFFRGARYWKWCTSWRHAALLNKGFWRVFITWKFRNSHLVRS